MRAFAQKPQATPQPLSVASYLRNRGSAAQPDVQGRRGAPGVTSCPRIGHDFSRIPVSASRTALVGEEVEEEPGPVSASVDAGAPPQADGQVPQRGRAGAVVAGMAAAPLPPAPIITTRTLISAPDHGADDRKKVGVNEEVEMRAPSAATWRTVGGGSGTIRPASGETDTVTWTAPGEPASCTVTATAVGQNPISVTMTVIEPTHRSLQRKKRRFYLPRLSGSGYFAKVTIEPVTVSFRRTKFLEDEVHGVATGYYNTLGLNGFMHPKSPWHCADQDNSGITDTIGTKPPGIQPPFKSGRFRWAIPQLHRPLESTGHGKVYSIAEHEQVMTGADGTERTSKEGSSYERTPQP